VNPSNWPEPQEFWSKRCVCVTGGAVFLGNFVVVQLRLRRATEIFVPEIKEGDLVKPEDIGRIQDSSRPDVVIHLAAHVGWIGANRVSPAEFFYANLIMGVQLLFPSFLN
jgi:GDP-L-fucose synthase